MDADNHRELIPISPTSWAMRYLAAAYAFEIIAMIMGGAGHGILWPIWIWVWLMLPSSAVFMILNNLASHYTQQSASFGHIQGIIAIYIWFIPLLNAPLVFIGAWLVQMRIRK